MSSLCKTCLTCKELKPLDLFHKAKNKSMGVHCVCKACKAVYDKSRPKRSYKKRDLTPEQYFNKLKQKAKYRAKKKLLKPPKILKTEEEKRAKKRLSNKKYEKTNKVRRLSQRLRRRLKKVIINHKSSNFTKLGHFGKMIGCSGPELIKHIESTWQPGMSWDNYGVGSDKWVIDHIRPIIDFFRKNHDPKLANHYSNLRALWWDDNAAKSVEDKYGSSPKSTPNPSPEYEPEFDNEGDTDTVLKGGEAE